MDRSWQAPIWTHCQNGRAFRHDDPYLMMCAKSGEAMAYPLWQLTIYMFVAKALSSSLFLSFSLSLSSSLSLPLSLSSSLSLCLSFFPLSHTHSPSSPSSLSSLSSFLQAYGYKSYKRVGVILQRGESWTQHCLVVISDIPPLFLFL